MNLNDFRKLSSVKIETGVLPKPENSGDTSVYETRNLKFMPPVNPNFSASQTNFHRNNDSNYFIQLDIGMESRHNKYGTVQTPNEANNAFHQSDYALAIGVPSSIQLSL